MSGCGRCSVCVGGGGGVVGVGGRRPMTIVTEV